MGRSLRYKTIFSLVLFDIDHFKKINYTYGHDVCDDVLKSLSLLIKNTIRTNDLFCRIGGEEFAVITPHTDLIGAIDLAEKIRLIVQNNLFETVGHLSISMGVVQYEHCQKKETLYKNADNALYKAKKQGRNRVISE